MINNLDYIKDLSKIVEAEYSKENKKLEKIQRVLESYPPSRKTNSIKREISINSNLEKKENEEECIENTLEQNDFSNKDEIFQKDDIRGNSDIDNFVNGNVELNLDGKNEENILQKSEIMSQAHDTKSDLLNESDKNQKVEEIAEEESLKSRSLKNSELSANCYIAPYSGWSRSKLEEEREISLQKVENLKKQIEVGKYFESEMNVNNLNMLEVPFEKMLFYFFENMDKIVDNIQLSNNISDVCKSAINLSIKSQPDLIRRNTSLAQKEDGDYDSYSSEDDSFKKKKPAKVISSLNIQKGNSGVNKIRSSAPLITDIRDYQREKNQRISEKLYMPFIKDKQYKLEVNAKLSKIKEDSKNNTIFTNKMNKKKDEVEKIGKQLFIYNNPNINIDNISNITYNSIVKYIFTNHTNKNKEN